MQRKIIFAVIISSVFILAGLKLFAVSLANVEPDDDKIYRVRLTNGDVMSGIVVAVEDSGANPSIRFKTSIGTANIYASEIEEIRAEDDFATARHRHRIFIMPTSIPIGNDHFIANYEVAMIYAGFGIGDILSVTGGRTAIPETYPGQQATLLNIKATVYNNRYEGVDFPQNMYMAFGMNMSFLNDANRLVHYYGNITVASPKTVATFNLFYKVGSEDYYTLKLKDNFYDFIYEDGTFGMGFGLTTNLPGRHDLAFVGEVWSYDVTKISHVGTFLGLRLANSSFSSDFGLILSSTPVVIPAFNFVWTPF